jgi:hypothetical protein
MSLRRAFPTSGHSENHTNTHFSVGKGRLAEAFHLISIYARHIFASEFVRKPYTNPGHGEHQNLWHTNLTPNRHPIFEGSSLKR